MVTEYLTEKFRSMILDIDYLWFNKQFSESIVSISWIQAA